MPKAVRFCKPTKMLDRNHDYKPLDFGNGLVAGSVNDQGRIIALNTYQPEHGYVTLTTMRPFPDDRWYDPAFVRQYRAEQASATMPGFGFSFGEQLSFPATCAIDLPAMPAVELELATGVTANILTFAPLQDDKQPLSGAIQLCTITNQRAEAYPLDYSWQGLLALTRASYAQLTEGGPLARPLDSYQVTHDKAILTLENSNLGQAVAIMVAEITANSDQFKPLDPWQIDDSSINFINFSNSPDGNNQSQVSLKLPGSLTLAARQTNRLIAMYGLGANAEQAHNNLSRLSETGLQDHTARHWEELDDIIQAKVDDPPGMNWLIRQNLAYILACCAVPVANGAVCMITDHQLLPLAWTRDAYYAIQALLALHRRAKTSNILEAQPFVTGLERLIRQHLIWLFEVAERPDGYWGRAYLTNGRCKDFIFQLDQQCYPLLELCDSVAATGDKELAQYLKPHLEQVLSGLLARRAKQEWLFPTSETPADDKVEMPYHLSSQITVWRTISRLAELAVIESHSPEQLSAIAEQIRHDIYRYMAVEHQGQKMFCYLTDLAGNYRFYHDANDWPTVLASSWGFCEFEDAIWQATLRYGFSPDNQGGYYPGKLGGLGSVHTPHPWPLGDFQELFLAYLQKDKVRLDRCLSKVLEVACWDGAFCEAYNEDTGQVASRHWFAWPGAMLVISYLS